MAKILPDQLDVVIREKDFVLYHQGQPLQTPAGHVITHASSRLLEHILRELALAGRTDADAMGPFAMFCFQRDHLEGQNDPLLAGLDTHLLADPLLARACGRAPEAANPQALEFFEKHPDAVGFVFGSIQGVTRSLNDMLMANGIEPLALATPDSPRVSGFLHGLYDALRPECRAAIHLLREGHEAGLVLPLLLVLGRITPSEYANTLSCIHLPEIMAVQSGNAHAGVKPDRPPPLEDSARLRTQAMVILEYLSYFQQSAPLAGISARALIAAGESFALEFKSSLRFNIKAMKNDPAIEHAALKTLCAFLNSDGGTLLIGVDDAGAVLGIEHDGFPNDDKFSLHFWNLVKAAMGQEIAQLIHMTLEKLDSKTVCIARCERSPKAIFLHQKDFDEEFYIRVGPSSARLSIQEALKYVRQRFDRASE